MNDVLATIAIIRDDLQEYLEVCKDERNKIDEENPGKATDSLAFNTGKIHGYQVAVDRLNGVLRRNPTKWKCTVIVEAPYGATIDDLKHLVGEDNDLAGFDRVKE